MARIEKTVFISYRRKDISWALLVYKYLTTNGYDVFFDVTSISSGAFERIILGNIRARAHFIVILTPSALDRCNKRGDWLRREIETAISEKRNIVPLFFDGFNFQTRSISKKLTGKLAAIKEFNGLNVHSDFFDAAMSRLCEQYLNVKLDAVLLPISHEVQKFVEEQQVAADVAIAQSEEREELFAEDQRTELLEEQRRKGFFSRLYQDNVELFRRWRPRLLWLVMFVFLIGMIILLGKFIPGGLPPLKPRPITRVSSKDGITMVYVQAGDFPMGSSSGDKDEMPVHTVYLDNYWIDQTEVTNAMYAKCVLAHECAPPRSNSSFGHVYFNNPDFDDYPVIHISWDDANTYCGWVGRRLPTEAEWEKAASWNEKAQSKYVYPWGNTFSGTKLNFCDKSCAFGWANKAINDKFADTAPVGNYPSGASPYGAYDMAGNVWEWVADWYSDSYYSDSSSANPSGPDSGEYRVLRGGAWLNLETFVRASDRNWSDPGLYNYDFGFRCAVGTVP